MTGRGVRAAVFLVALCLLCGTAAAASQCYGSVGKGRLEDGVKLPLKGDNFSVYSVMAATAGRTHLHATAAAIVTDAYASLHASSPGVHYVYGETGLPSGGRFYPHRTHQNGLSADFFVPVRDAQGRSVPVPTEVATRFGYDLEFDRNAAAGQYRIDFSALAEHLYQLDQAARKRGVGISKIIFDTDYLPRLFATARGPYLKKLPFMRGKPWVRHDEHYHVDFGIACRKA